MQRDNTKLITNLAIIAGVYLLIARPILEKVGILKAPPDKNFVNDIKNQKTNDKRPRTITDTKAEQIAKAQYDAMNRPGTDEITLFRTLDNLTGEDLKKVFEKFGKPRYSITIGNRDLFGWYRAELNKNELTIMRRIWHKSGATP